ncbi:MAG: Plug domain-containing protein [Bacteroidales bacterium]|nr:Plug domain-containing protein [Bacteroidales bacterium]
MSTSFFMRLGQRLSLSVVAMAFSFNVFAAESADLLPDSPESLPQDSTALLLEQITVSAGLKNERNSPLRLQSVDDSQIRAKAVGRTYPELLRDIPGIYSTAETGSYGDAKINIRGFKQENISVLLNGIPISGLTTGNMFWNNWLGLTDAT